MTESAEVFGAHRGVLTGPAYRMPGSVTDAEDVVREAWLCWSRSGRVDVRDLCGS